MKSPKLIPLYVLCGILSIPATFLYCLHYFFAINDISRLIDFAILIIDNLGKRPMKTQVYISLALSPIPTLLFIYMISGKRVKKAHGNAKWAKEKDIECYKFNAEKFTQSLKDIINPLKYFSPNIIKSWKVMLNC